MKLPSNIGELFSAALDIEKAKKTVVAVNLFIDECSSSDFQVFVRSGFNSESPNSRVMISYFPTQTPDVEAPCDIAMTGEVSLRGTVMPIGGLPEKLMAAQRAGVKRVFIPYENVDDLEDVADEVKEKLQITPVKEVRELLGKVLD